MPYSTPEARRAYHQTYAARLHALGRCTVCRGGPVATGHVLCDDCRYALRVYRYDHYERTRLQSVRQPPAPRPARRPVFQVLWTADVLLR